MAGPLFWAPGKITFFLQDKLFMPMKLIRLGGYLGFWGGGSADFILMGVEIFLRIFMRMRCAFPRKMDSETPSVS